MEILLLVLGIFIGISLSKPKRNYNGHRPEPPTKAPTVRLFPPSGGSNVRKE